VIFATVKFPQIRKKKLGVIFYMGFHHFKSPRNKNWFAYLKKKMSYKQSSFFKIELIKIELQNTRIFKLKLMLVKIKFGEGVLRED
jgi:hypothetical protein